MFQTPAIVLHTQQIRDQQARVILFTRDFWKITTWYKKRSLPDTGSTVAASIERKWWENILSGYDMTKALLLDTLSYEKILAFLDLLKHLYTLLPEGMVQLWIYEDIDLLIEKWLHAVSEDALLLSQFRMIKKLGYIWEDTIWSDDISIYIHKNISMKSMESILSTKPLSESTKLSLKKSLLQAQALYS